jgi:hypothetical protein
MKRGFIKFSVHSGDIRDGESNESAVAWRTTNLLCNPLVEQQFADGYYLNLVRVGGFHINFRTRFRYYMIADPIPALKNSRFIRAMLEMEISLGHSASHSLSLEQLPKQSSSIFRTIARARWAASGLP